ncbi:hypothetical protein LEP48_17230 [Isoptericola sp. NEAU-Y5]|uniref:Integral membrane protein n=1 Tax=Isoptericola luteus TaxID=2879484 RepID=A0ABS7ZJ78_9MICO|nr:hypothetical protein [Isoptericola sp. NEAU-Y5]MCA5895075.1 hypothetical protein [Isoptericola sp. NEAU-Y5]
MSNNGTSDDRGRDARGAAPSRTASTILLVGFVIIVAGGVTARFAPDLFASLGGWVTVGVVAVLMVVLGSLGFIRGMRRNADTSDDTPR